MINKISFKNYKIFKKTQILEIKPITVLIGKNNSGKSAVLKLPTLIEGALDRKNVEAFNLNNDGVSIGDEYKDIVYGKQFKAVGLELYQKKALSKEFDFLKTDVFIDSEKGFPVIETWKCNDVYDLEKLDNDNYLNSITGKVHQVNFKGITLEKLDFFDEMLPVEDYQLPFFQLKTDFIGGLRQKPKKNYEYSKTKSKSGIDGSNLYDFLIEDSQTTDKKYFKLVSNWLKEKFEGWELKIEFDGHKKEIPAIIELTNNNLDINITQTGMGISQVLPLIIRAYKPSIEKELIIIEEPESHLHPYAHAQIAQLFVESIKDDENKNYLIETHSQNFVLRLRRLVAEGELSNKDIAIYYVDFDEELNESKLSKIYIDDKGGVEWWPEGVFGETSLESRAIYNAQLNDLKNVD